MKANNKTNDLRRFCLNDGLREMKNTGKRNSLLKTAFFLIKCHENRKLLQFEASNTGEMSLNDKY